MIKPARLDKASIEENKMPPPFVTLLSLVR